ncbi:hypothetical protein BDV96DRAFT_593556 [Lophiotrema nucula]|uniref:Heterokaryon incompatibility domain-containing protein n=1 Tax=Lophiotrema nucula TaxID=690887 RepID=A0A6A5ZUZ2_9PLEO|nr:hypothetical protein BDV96DRAFT_593556 [Lophiotrema nucula]
MSASLLNAPLYLAFRYGNEGQLGSKHVLRFGPPRLEPVICPYIPYSDGNYKRQPDSDKSSNYEGQPPYHTRLLDRREKTLQNAILDSTGGMTIHGTPIPFVALSHTWATSGSWGRAEWLRALNLSLGRSTNGSNRYCWIDSLCVDQQSHAEVAAAVAAMGRLYTAANTVMVQDMHIPLPDAMLLRIARYCPGTALSLVCSYWLGKRVHARPKANWFSRIWTLQEGRLAKRLLCWSDWGLKVRLSQYLHTEHTFALDSGLDEPETTHHVFSAMSTSEILDIAQSRSATKENDQMFGLFGLLPPIVASKVGVDYDVPLVGVYKQVVQCLFDLHDYSLLSGSEGVRQRTTPRWLPPFGSINPAVGPCALPGSATIRDKGMEFGVAVFGVVQSSHKITSDDYTPERYKELICEAYVGSVNAQFVEGVWRAREYCDEDYDEEEMADLTRLMFDDAAKIGGMYDLTLKLELTGDVQRRLGWADAPLEDGDIVAARCLDKTGGALVILRAEGFGFLEVGGLYGGLHVPIAELPRKRILLVA